MHWCISTKIKHRRTEWGVRTHGEGRDRGTIFPIFPKDSGGLTFRAVELDMWIDEIFRDFRLKMDQNARNLTILRSRGNSRPLIGLKNSSWWLRILPRGHYEGTGESTVTGTLSHSIAFIKSYVEAQNPANSTLPSYYLRMLHTCGNYWAVFIST